MLKSGGAAVERVSLISVANGGFSGRGYLYSTWSPLTFAALLPSACGAVDCCKPDPSPTITRLAVSGGDESDSHPFGTHPSGPGASLPPPERLVQPRSHDCVGIVQDDHRGI